MSTERISLSNPMFAARIKKFDRYELRPRSMHRATKTTVSEIKPLTAITDQTKSWHQYSPLQQTSLKPEQAKRADALLKPISLNHPSVPPNNSAAKSLITNSALQSRNIALQAVASAPAQDYLSEQFIVDAPPAKKRLSKTQKFFYGAGISVFAFATLVSAQTFITNLQTKKQVGVLGEQSQLADSQGVAEGSSSEPAESPVSSQAIAGYRVDPELPRYLRIPDLKVFARIKHTGVDKNGAVGSPKNINDVSWFDQGAVPGAEVGSSLLLGHVSGWSAHGVFKKIDQLKAGMRFEVEKGSGEKLTYEVVSGQKIPVDQIDMSKILGTENAGEHDLKLMTCSGKYNKETKQYEERYVVFAKILR